MKTQRQKINAARKKIEKLSTELEGIVDKLSNICEDLEDEEICDEIGQLNDCLSEIVEGDAKVSFPSLIETIDGCIEKLNEEDEEE